MRNIRPSVRLLILVAVMALIRAACSGDGASDTTEAATDTTEPATETTEAPTETTEAPTDTTERPPVSRSGSEC